MKIVSKKERLLKEQQLLEKQMADMAERMAEITEELNNLKTRKLAVI